MSTFERISADRSGLHHVSVVLGALRTSVVHTARFFRNRVAIKQMVDMDDALLKDIGLTRSEVERAYVAPLSHDTMSELKQAARVRASRMSV